MANFSADALRHSCLWDTPEETGRSITGFPDDIKMDWRQGYELLHFINRYMEYRKWDSVITFRKIESIIKTRLPVTIVTHKAIKDWLDNNL